MYAHTMQKYVLMKMTLECHQVEPEPTQGTDYHLTEAIQIQCSEVNGKAPEWKNTRAFQPFKCLFPQNRKRSLYVFIIRNPLILPARFPPVLSPHSRIVQWPNSVCLASVLRMHGDSSQQSNRDPPPHTHAQNHIMPWIHPMNSLWPTLEL